MKYVIFFLSLFISIIGFSQDNLFQVLSNETNFGKNHIDNSDINGIRYIFPEKIHKTFLDTASGYLTVQLIDSDNYEKSLSNYGNILQYDLKNNYILWTKQIAYQTSYLQQFDNTIIYNLGNKSCCLNIHSGEEVWKIKNNICFVDSINNIGIGYKNSTAHTNELEGINLKNGKKIWKRELNREYNWKNVFYVNDSTIIVVAAGLHAINVKTGEGWDFTTLTGEKDYTGTIVANTVGIVTGLLTGMFFYTTGHKLIYDLVSNTIVDSSHIYFASKEQIVNIDKHTGEIIWEYFSPNDIASKSSIFTNDSLLFIVNKGMGFVGNKQVNYGQPFFAAFDKYTGKQVFFALLYDKHNPIQDFKTQDKEIVLVFKNSMMKYSIETGDLIAEMEFPKESYGELKHVIGEEVYVTSQNGDFISLSQSNPNRLFVMNNKGTVLSIDKNLHVTETIEPGNLSICYLQTKNLKFIATNKHTLIVNNVGREIAKIEATSKSFKIGNFLYDTQDRSFSIIDLTPILIDK